MEDITFIDLDCREMASICLTRGLSKRLNKTTYLFVDTAARGWVGLPFLEFLEMVKDNREVQEQGEDD